MAARTSEHDTAEDEADWPGNRERRAVVMRSLHDQLDPPAGWRVEIIAGELVVSPAPMPAHAYLVEIIRTAVGRCLDPGSGIYENVEFDEPETDRYLPDLAVWRRKALRAETGRPNSAFCKLLIEVTSLDTSKREYEVANGYARSRVPTYLLVDRTKRVCVVHTDPGDGRYRELHQTPFGMPVTLPLDPPVTIETMEF